MYYFNTLEHYYVAACKTDVVILPALWHNLKRSELFYYKILLSPIVYLWEKLEAFLQ